MKITFVGGGSLVWGTMVLTDMALNAPLQGATIALQDIDQAALDLMARMGQKISQQAGAGFKVETTTDLHAAVDGADVVVDCVGVGGLDAMRADLEIPARYDVFQPESLAIRVPNRGQISNLAPDAVVESYAAIDRTGVRPEVHGPLPPGPAAVCQKHLVEQELTVDAAIEGDRRKALQALCMDPAIQRWDIAGPLLDEMLRATAAHLPQFR